MDANQQEVFFDSILEIKDEAIYQKCLHLYERVIRASQEKDGIRNKLGHTPQFTTHAMYTQQGEDNKE